MAAIALVGVATGCIEGNDWDVDSSAAGTFRPISFSASQVAPGDEQVEFSFGKTPGTVKFEIEASTDSLYLDETSEGSLVEQTTKSPFLMGGFEMDTIYFARVRAYSEAAGWSKWTYLEKYSFKTKSEQIMNGVAGADILPTSIRVTWPAKSEVTKILYWTGDATPMELILTEEQIAEGAASVPALNPMSTYRFELYNGDKRRGYVTATTPSAGPEAEYMMSFNTGSTMQEQIDVIAAKAAADGKTSYTVTVVIPAGIEGKCSSMKPSADDPTVLEESQLVIPEGMSVTFYGERGEAADKLVIFKDLVITGAHTFIKFENLTVTGTSYLFNQSKACNVDSIVVDGCKVNGFVGNTAFRFRDDNIIKSLKLRNSVFDNCAKGYGFIHVTSKSGAQLSNLEIDGCTFSNVCATGKCFFMIDGAGYDMSSLKISNSTFYNVCGGGQYFIDMGKEPEGNALSYVFENNILAKSADDVTNKNVRGGIKEIDVTNCYHTTDWFKNIQGSTALEKSSADIFKDAANGDFTLKADALPAGITCGDPRWIVVE